MLTPFRLTTATSSISFECLNMCRYGLSSRINETCSYDNREFTYLRKTNHLFSQVFSLASVMTIR